MQYKVLKRGMVCVLAVILFLVWYKNAQQLQQRYEVPEKIVDMGETLIYNDWRIIPIAKSEIMDGSTFKSTFDVKNTSVAVESKYMCVKLEVEMLSESCRIDKFLETEFRSDTWSNGIDPFLFYDINGENILKIKGEKKGILYIPVEFFPDHWRKDRYRKLEQESFQYVIAAYPVIVRVAL